MVACGDVGDAPKAETGEEVAVEEATGTTMVIDTAQSSITWLGAKVTGTHDGGFNNFSGTVSTENGMVTNVDVTIDMNSVWSDTEKLTGHLKTKDFFLVEEYPEATFKASAFEKVDTVEGATHMVTGNLTMRGKTNAVTFPATITVTDDKVTAKAEFRIDRMNWDIAFRGAEDNLVEHEVAVKFDLTATKKGEEMAANR